MYIAYKISIELSNDAFSRSKSSELARILHSIATEMEEAERVVTKRKILDINGNNTGKSWIEKY